MRRLAVMAVTLLLVAASCAPAMAVEPDEVLQDQALEARARALSVELRCLVCQNQSIDDSNAPLARDLRLLVRERLAAGDSDAAVMQFIVARYGTFVLLRPPVDRNTAVLWAAPLLVLTAAGAMLWRRARRVTSGPLPAELSASERRRLAELDAKP